MKKKHFLFLRTDKHTHSAPIGDLYCQSLTVASVIPVMVFELQLELQLVIFFIFQLQLLLQLLIQLLKVAVRHLSWHH